MAETVPVSVRLGTGVIKQLRNKAEERGMSVSGFIKYIVLKYLDDFASSDK